MNIGNSRDFSEGFTLIELVMVIALVGILAGVGVIVMAGSGEATRFETTRERLQMIRTALIGDDFSQDTEGKRTQFGYVGDVGALPSSLNDLVTKPTAVPNWAFNATDSLGAGWRGPYITIGFTGALAIDRDGWGRSLVYNPTGSPATITSYGADGVAGGTGQDLVMTIAASEYRASVRGLLQRGTDRLSGRTVEIRYPLSGSVTVASSVTDANGSFLFSNIPWGARSLRVSTAPVLGPKPILIDRSDVLVSESLLNYLSGVLTLVAGSAATGGTGKKIVLVSLSSTYDEDLQLSAVTATWTGVTSLTDWSLNGYAQNLGALASGSRFMLSGNETIPARSVNNSIVMDFSGGMGNKTLTLVFEYDGRTSQDTINFNTP